MKSDEQILIEAYQDVVNEGSERFEPDYENDIFMEYNNRDGRYDVSSSGKHLKGGMGWDDAIEFILEWMEESNWYPNVWDIDDHGGLRLVNLDEESRVDESSIISSMIKSDNGLTTASKNSTSPENLCENMTKLVKYFKVDEGFNWKNVNWVNVYNELNEGNKYPPIPFDDLIINLKAMIGSNQIEKAVKWYMDNADATTKYGYDKIKNELKDVENFNEFRMALTNASKMNEAERLEGYPKNASRSEKKRTLIYRTLLKAIRDNIANNENVSFGDISICLTTPEETHPNVLLDVHNDNVMWVFNTEENPRKITIKVRALDFAREVENYMMEIDDSLMFKMVDHAVGYLYKE